MSLICSEHRLLWQGPSRLLPFSEKSALNHFNLENVTTYSMTSSTSSSSQPASAAEGEGADSSVAKLQEAEEGEEDMEIDSEGRGESSPGGPVDFNLYQKLWSLQDFFRQPTQCFIPDLWNPLSNCNHILTYQGLVVSLHLLAKTNGILANDNDIASTRYMWSECHI